ncbi:MAG: glycoside hydrolase family 2 TIM barrel-domain containing protein [Bacteroidota bacterium]|nr:glycoside hydrolase family 2 TIM barrel-domain containing protein [Bacteroidota bacterium]
MEKSLFRLSLYITVLALFPILLFSQQLFYENGSPSHPNVLGFGSSTRSIIELAGDWDYSLDGGTTWRKIKVPSAASYEGKIIYRRKFLVDSNTVGNSGFTFVAYGINYQADVFINETFIGKHEGGYTSFTLSIPENLIQVGAENIIRVVVDNSLNYKTTFPTHPQVSGWKNYNGIVRDIFIVAAPKAFINNVNVTIESIEPKAVTLHVESIISAKDLQTSTLAGKQFQLSAQAADAATGTAIGKPVITSIIVQQNQDVTVDLSLVIPNAKLWSPESPELYSVTVQLQTIDGKQISLLDETSATTGIRTITKDKSNLLFNAAPITLRGVVWIEDSENHGSSLTYEEMERDVALIKNLGANAVRIGFHPPHPFFLQLCDRYGLLVLEEIPNYEIPAQILENENYRSVVEAYLKEMIGRDAHHPSIIAWGFGDGFGVKGDADNSIIAQLQRTAKSLDDRLTYFISHSETNGISKIVDIAAIEYNNSDARVLKDQLISWKENHRNQPILVGGYHRAAEKGNRNGYSDPMSQEAQARGLLQQYATIRDLDLSGSFIYSFNDFRSDRPVMSVKLQTPDVHANGIVELDREKKVAYGIIRAAYLNEKISALPIGTFVVPSPYAYVVIGLVLLMVAAWLINGNRRYRESTRRAIFNSYNFFADIRDQFTLPLFHTVITSLIIATTFSVVLSSILFHFRTSMVLDYIFSYVFPDNFKLVIIQMAWNPLLSVGYLTVATMVWFLVLTFLIQFFSLVARIKIRLFHSYSIAVWTALPWAFFIPVAMILYRLIESDPYVPWILSLVAVMCVWIYIRTLKGISVIYHVYTPKMYLIGAVLVLFAAGGLFAYGDYALSLTAYTDFFFSTIVPFVH